MSNHDTIRADHQRELGQMEDFWLSMWVSLMLSPFLLPLICLVRTNIRQRYGILIGGNVNTIIYAIAILALFRPTVWQTVLESLFLGSAVISIIAITIRYVRIVKSHSI